MSSKKPRYVSRAEELYQTKQDILTGIFDVGWASWNVSFLTLPLFHPRGTRVLQIQADLRPPFYATDTNDACNVIVGHISVYALRRIASQVGHAYIEGQIVEYG